MEDVDKMIYDYMCTGGPVPALGMVSTGCNDCIEANQCESCARCHFDYDAPPMPSPMPDPMGDQMEMMCKAVATCPNFKAEPACVAHAQGACMWDAVDDMCKMTGSNGHAGSGSSAATCPNFKTPESCMATQGACMWDGMCKMTGSNGHAGSGPSAATCPNFKTPESCMATQGACMWDGMCKMT